MTKLEELKQAMEKAGISMPARINFLLIRNTKDGKYSIMFNKMNSSCKLENIKFSQTGALFFSSNIGVSVGIEDIDDCEMLQERLEYYGKRWIDMPEIEGEEK